MWSYLRSLVTPDRPTGPGPSLVTVKGIRFPADGGMPHIISIKTTTDGVVIGADSPWGHIPDMRKYWQTEQAWLWRDVDTFRLENQPLPHCNGLYVTYSSYDLESLPVNTNFPVGIYGRERAFAGDAFVFKLKGTQIGEELGEDGWVAWIDVPSDIMDLPVMKM